MIRKTHTLMVVHAHPDDEASSTGGLLRFAAEQGHTTIVVTCTHGDCGEVKIPGLRLHPRQVPADRQRLALIRQEEVAHAAALLGVTHVYQLGYHDSGMAGWASNQQRQAFMQAPLEDVTGRLVPLIRRHRPEVVVTYDAHGGYGHPDHIRLCRKIAFSGQSPKIVYWKIKDLRVQTFLFSVICYRAGSYASRPCSLRNSPVLSSRGQWELLGTCKQTSYCGEAPAGRDDAMRLTRLGSLSAGPSADTKLVLCHHCCVLCSPLIIQQLLVPLCRGFVPPMCVGLSACVSSLTIRR